MLTVETSSSLGSGGDQELEEVQLDFCHCPSGCLGIVIIFHDS